MTKKRDYNVDVIERRKKTSVKITRMQNTRLHSSSVVKKVRGKEWNVKEFNERGHLFG